MSLMNKLSTQGRELVDKAKRIANDPKTRAKIDEAREKIEDRVSGGKDKAAKQDSQGEGAPQASSDAPSQGSTGGDGPKAEAPQASSDAPSQGSTGGDGPKAA